jgi:hypothetical protein
MNKLKKINNGNFYLFQSIIIYLSKIKSIYKQMVEGYKHLEIKIIYKIV